MDKLIGVTIALATVVAVTRAIHKKRNKFTFTITNLSNELLADITEKNILVHEDVRVYFNGDLID